MAANKFSVLAVEAIDLGCSRAGRVVFTGVSFRLTSGQLLAVTGPNGSGKSSLLRLLAGLLKPLSGQLSFSRARDDETLAHYLGHTDALKPAMTLRETLRFWSAIYRQQGRAPLDPDFDEASDKVGLRHALGLPAGVLSAGQRRRAGLARLLLTPRPLWLLDEPTSSLDNDGVKVLAALMTAHLSAGGLVVAATHQDLPIPADTTVRLG